MALNDGLFANPTTGESDFGASSLKESQRAFKNLSSQRDANTEELKRVISQFTNRKTATPKSKDIDLSNIMSEFGATDYEESAGAEGGLSGFWDAAMAAKDQGFDDASLGSSLVYGDTETNMLAAEQKYQKSLSATPKRLGYDPDSFSSWFDADWLGNVAGGTMPSLLGMFGGGAAGAGAGSVIPVLGTAAGAISGASAGSGALAGLQTLGGTFTQAYASYRSQGKSNKEAFNMAYDIAKVDGFKSGAFASVATLLAPLRVTGNVLKPSSLGVATSFNASKPVLGQAVSQAVQQTLILQPSLEVSDVILSNKIARDSFDTNREIYKGALDAAVGSIFFDFPTTSAGLAYNYARSGKLKAPFSPDSDSSATLGITDETGEARSVDGEVLGPENIPSIFEEGADTSSGTIVDLDPNEFTEINFNPDNQTDRSSFLSNQISRMEAYDNDKRATNENYSGDVKVANTVNFFKWLSQGDKIIQQINSIKDVAVRNSEANQRKLGDAQERVTITKLMMDPVKNVVVPRYVFQTANGQVFRVVLSKNGNPLSPFQKSGKPQKTHITVFDPSSKTGTRSIAKSSGTLSSSGVPVPKNILLTADVYSRLINARNRMFAEMDEADAFDAANQPVQQGQITQTDTKKLSQSDPTPVELTERQTQAQEKIETAAEGQTSGDVIPVTQDNAVQPPLPFNQTQTPETQTGTKYFADPETGQYDMNQGFEFNKTPEQDQVIDQAEAETEVEYTQKTTKPRLPDGSIDRMASPLTSLSDGKNTLYTSRLAAGIDSSVGWYQVDEKGFPPPAPTYSVNFPLADTKSEAIEVLKNKLAQMSNNQTVKFARTQNIKSNDAVQRAGELPLGEGLEGLLTNVPGNDKPAVRKIINMFAKTLGKDLEKVDVVNLASYLTRMEIDPEIADGMIGAYLRGWIKQTEGNLQRGAIAIRLNQQPSVRVESLAHELVHFGIKMKNITPEMMVDMYNSIPDTDFNKQFIENDPYYKDLNIADKAEEYIAYTLGEMVENRYRGPITRRSGEYENKIQYFIRQIIRAIREFFERLTGKNLVDDYLNNIKTKYGMDTEANNPFEDQTAVYGREAPVEETTPSFARDKNDKGGIDTPSKSIEDIQRAIPDYRRASVQKQFNTLSLTIDGQKFTDLDLNQRGIGYVGKKPVSQIWQETLDKVPGAKAELEKLGLTNKMVPRDGEFWNSALKLPDRARYWYEISSEVIGNYFPDMKGVEIEKFWDVVAATSPMADPIDNMYRTIALLSEHYQGKPITTDLVSPTAVTTALSDEFLGAPKTRSFSGTFLYLSGERNEIPLSTNDRQVASSFGITGDDIANNFVMYHILSEFYIKIRDEQNANLPAGAQPYETWQIQAPAWVHERGLSKVEKNEVQNYDDYALVIQNRVLPKLKEQGISIPNDKLTIDVLRNPKVPYALRDNLLGFQEAYVGTVEVNTQSNVVGKQFEENYSLIKGQEGFVGATKEADTIIADGMRKLTARSRINGRKLPSILDQVATAMVGKKVSLVRVTTDGYGTYGGFTSPNIRIPMRYKDSKGYGNFDEKDVDVFLSLLSGPLGQEAAAAGLFVDADLNEQAPAGFDRTFSVFVKTKDGKVIPDNVTGRLSAAINKPVSVSNVANGYVFDIHLEGGPSITDEKTVVDAVYKTDLALYGEINLIPRDYKVRFFERVATPYSDGYSKNISDFKKGIVNEAVQEISDLSPRIGKGQARDYIIGNIEQITTVSSSIQKRIERIRIRSRERVNNLDEVRDRVRSLHDEMKVKQKAFNKKIEPKVQNLKQSALLSEESIAPYPEDVDTENDIDPLFARRSTNPSKTQETLEKISKNSFTGIFTSSARRLVGLARGTDIAYKLANILDRDKYARTSRDTTGTIEMDVHEEINQGLGKFTQQFNDILNNMTTAQIKLVPDLLRGKFVNKDTGRIQITPEMQRVGLTINKAVELRKLMNDLYSLIELTYGKYGAPPPPKILMYFPQIYKLDGKFTDGILRGLDKTQGLQDFFKQVFTNDGVQDADVKAQDLVSKILNEGNAPTWGFDLATVAGQKVFRFTPQEMRRVIKMNPYQEFDVTMANGQVKKMKLADFLDNDTYGVLQKYITTTVRRMAFVNRFGPKAEKITEAVNEGGTIDQELGARGEAPLSPEDRSAIFNLIRANLGILPTHSFFGAGKSDTSYGVQQGMKSFTNLLFLNLSFLPATLEPLIAFNRLGMFGGLATLNEYAKNTLRMPYRMVKSTAKGAFTKGTVGDKYREFKKAYDADDSDLQIFAKHIGTIFEGFQYAYQNAAEVNASVKWEKVDQIIFKYNLLQPITDATRVAALRGAIVSLPHWAKKAKKGSKMYTRYLQEVGLVASDLDMFDTSDPMGTSNPKIRAALNDMVASIIIAPDAGRKPTWMSDPRFGLLSHIKTWTFTFTNTVLQRSYKELMAHGNPMPLVYLAGFGAMLSLQHSLREWMTYGEEGNPFLNEMFDEEDDTLRFVYNAFERGGLFGVFQFAADFIVGSRIGRQSFDPGGTLIPAYNLVKRFGDVLAGLVQSVNTDAREQAKGLRKAFDNFTRLLPLISITGQARKDLVDYVTPKAGRKKKNSSFNFNFNTKAFGGNSFKSFGQ